MVDAWSVNCPDNVESPSCWSVLETFGKLLTADRVRCDGIHREDTRPLGIPYAVTRSRTTPAPGSTTSWQARRRSGCRSHRSWRRILSSSSGGVQWWAPSTTCTQQMPQLAWRQAKGTPARTSSSHTSTMRAPSGHSTTWRVRSKMMVGIVKKGLQVAHGVLYRVSSLHRSGGRGALHSVSQGAYQGVVLEQAPTNDGVLYRGVGGGHQGSSEGCMRQLQQPSSRPSTRRTWASAKEFFREGHRVSVGKALRRPPEGCQSTPWSTPETLGGDRSLASTLGHGTSCTPRSAACTFHGWSPR